ncbi:TIGR04066 family peptide maturation system protein [Ruminiclostridium herbifermentans]|uniref:TIGR04066 family peptide maturation system protein n=1 Tax=Ruminiclostridium herbifermentans TaxID=2488810 RepID=A0A4U7JG71_9FIRM|nr:TIGR04066 family peptide maturation system protein [Ruminiclostridium herbifermentans]QNU67995.1 TIGR04066 family peptide maturation system protein [Ruminiclostridium herbifermentans]
MKVMVFPYDFEFLPIFKNRHLLKDIIIKYLVSPSGFGLTGKDGCFFNNEIDSGIIIQDHMTKEDLMDIDAVWLTESLNKLNDEEIKTTINTIGQYAKQIIYTPNGDKEFEQNINELCKKYNLKVTMPRDYIDLYKLVDERTIVSSFTLRKFETPVITVLGICGMTQKFDIQLYLRSHFLKNGYKVSQIGTKQACEILGFHSIPDFLFEKNYSEVEKILKFNSFIKEIEKKEKPDLIIIGVPDAIIPLNRKHHLGFGIPAYEICSAIQSDFSILSMFNGEYSNDFFDEMSKVCKYRLNIELDAFFISNYTPISNSLDQENLVFTYTKGTEKINDRYPIYNVRNLNDDKLFNHVVKKLAMYGEFSVM